MSKPKTITIINREAPGGGAVILPPEKGELTISPTVGLVQMSWTDSELAERIKKEMAEVENVGRVAVYRAIGIGIQLIFKRDSGQRGDLGSFIDGNFEKKKRSTLFNYIRVARDFLENARALDRKTHKLLSWDAVAPVTSTQLHLFMSPEAEHFDGILKKLVKYVGNRSLSDLYRSLTEQEMNPPNHTGKKLKTMTAIQKLAQREKDALQTGNDIASFRGVKKKDGTWDADWVCMKTPDLGKLADLLEMFRADVAAEIKRRKAEEAAR